MCHPFVDFTEELTAHELDFYTNSSANAILGFGGYFGCLWFAGIWDPGFIREKQPSIEYLELYAITVAILLWAERLANLRVVIFTDNQTAMNILNNTSSSCRNCMVLVRMIVMTQLKFNVRIFCSICGRFQK